MMENSGPKKISLLVCEGCGKSIQPGTGVVLHGDLYDDGGSKRTGTYGEFDPSSPVHVLKTSMFPQSAVYINEDELHEMSVGHDDGVMLHPVRIHDAVGMAAYHVKCLVKAILSHTGPQDGVIATEPSGFWSMLEGTFDKEVKGKR